LFAGSVHRAGGNELQVFDPSGSVLHPAGEVRGLQQAEPIRFSARRLAR
jgi:hypothetical protein